MSHAEQGSWPWILAVSLIGALATAARAENPATVLVVNPSSDSDPVRCVVQGTSSVSGSLSIVNAVSLVPDTLVKVANAADTPPHFRNLDEPASNPFKQSLEVTIPDQEYAQDGDEVAITVQRTDDSTREGAITTRASVSGSCLIRMN
jgi:hypothetical protein